ncbi:I78 family peptidase inhibitor, partial [Sphingorhabdus sp.]
ADTVRVAPQNGMITMDFSPLRLNIFHDDKKVIVQINCG